MKPSIPATILSGLFLLTAILTWNMNLALVSVTYTIMSVVIGILPREKVERFLEAS